MSTMSAVATATPAGSRPTPRAGRSSDCQRAMWSGFDGISDVGLLELLIGGTKERTQFDRAFSTNDGLVGIAALSPADLARRLHLTPQSAVRVAAVGELARRLARSRRQERRSMRTPEEVIDDVGAYFAPLAVEELWCLPLDPHSRLIGEPRMISRGDTDGTEAGPRAFLRAALTACATSCIAVHNHPSGDITPSAADRAVTQRLVAAGRSIDIPVVDHVIVGDGSRFTSLRRTDPALFR